MEKGEKRKSEGDGGERRKKKVKKWKVLKKWQSGGGGTSKAATIEPGDCGIWVTCELRKEGKCTAELRDLFDEYSTTMYGLGAKDDDTVNSGNASKPDADIETEIKKEVEGLRVSSKKALIQPVKLDTQCVLFFKTLAPIEPVSLVHKICADASESPNAKKHRWVQRLTPMSRMGRATEKGLEDVSRAVLAPIFHQEGTVSRKFAIRTTIRNHSVMERDGVIKRVADIVGNMHSVDLKNYDLLILVDIYQNICGMSVVGNYYEKLKRFNLAEIYDPTAKSHPGKP